MVIYLSERWIHSKYTQKGVDAGNTGHFKYGIYMKSHRFCLIHCHLVTSYWLGKIGHRWFRKWIAAWRHQAITWTNFDVSSVEPCDIYLIATASVRVSVVYNAFKNGIFSHHCHIFQGTKSSAISSIMLLNLVLLSLKVFIWVKHLKWALDHIDLHKRLYLLYILINHQLSIIVINAQSITLYQSKGTKGSNKSQLVLRLTRPTHSDDTNKQLITGAGNIISLAGPCSFINRPG